MSILIQSEPPFFQSPQCTPHGKTYDTWILVSWLSDRDSGSCLGLLLDEFICRLKSGGVMDPGPSYKTLQTNDFRFLNFWKSPLQAQDTVTKLVKILWRLPTLTRCSLPCRGATVLGHYSSARALPSGGSGFWIFAKLHSRPEKLVFEHKWAIFTKFGEIPQMLALFEWPWLPEVQLTWVLFGSD